MLLPTYMILEAPYHFIALIGNDDYRDIITKTKKTKWPLK